MLAERAGLEVDDGIVCDARLETSVAGHLRRRRRLLATTASSTAGGCGSSTGTWRCSRAATSRGRCSASDEPYREIPYFFSDLADWASLEYVGPAREWDEVVWRGDATTASSAPGIVDGRRGRGALAVGRSEDLSTRGR